MTEKRGGGGAGGPALYMLFFARNHSGRCCEMAVQVAHGDFDLSLPLTEAVQKEPFATFSIPSESNDILQEQGRKTCAAATACHPLRGAQSSMGSPAGVFRAKNSDPRSTQYDGLMLHVLKSTLRFLFRREKK